MCYSLKHQCLTSCEFYINRRYLYIFLKLLFVVIFKKKLQLQEKLEPKEHKSIPVSVIVEKDHAKENYMASVEDGKLYLLERSTEKTKVTVLIVLINRKISEI